MYVGGEGQSDNLDFDGRSEVFWPFSKKGFYYDETKADISLRLTF